MGEQATSSKQIKHVFSWATPYKLTHDICREHMLVKGVCAVEGEWKTPGPDGKPAIADSKHIIMGAGALRASATQGHALCGVDHHQTLPESYLQKHGAELAKPYPVATMLDAEPVEHDGKWSIEFIAACRNEHVYQMIEEGKFVGCSVEDKPRSIDCDDLKCTYEGSLFHTNTFVLEGVPDGNGTWVAPITSDDVGHVLVGAETEGATDILEKHKADLKHLADVAAAATAAKPEPTTETVDHAIPKGDLDTYYRGGAWINGADSIKEYMVREKDIAPDMAMDMAEYIHARPGLLNESQLRHMSTQDLQAWWTHNHVLAGLAAEMSQLKKHVADIAGGSSSPSNLDAVKTALEAESESETKHTLIIDDPAKTGKSHAIVSAGGGDGDGITDEARQIENNRKMHAQWLDAEILKEEQIINSLSMVWPGPTARVQQAALEAARGRLHKLIEKKRNEMSTLPASLADHQDN